ALAGGPDELGPAAAAAYQHVRDVVPTLDRDRYMADDIERTASALQHGEFLAAVEAAIGGLR
ncbi:hypothetical protein, partial [Actinoalloteichus caeruleus]|uniref:hypothetical protein n=1 Tax=Actinoalloteichus cyanogriseus TaxID=2893586 RepID=UPI0004AB0983